jgi:DNA-binding CsgD family transcriptional regulator
MKISMRIQRPEIANQERGWRLRAGLSFLYVVGNVIAGESVIGLLTVPLCYAFAQRSGFFKTRGREKRFAMVLLFLAALGTQCRFGIGFLCKSCVSIITALFLCSRDILLFLPKLQKRADTEQRPVIRLSPDIFTRRDVEILNKVLTGEKYAAIAAEYGLAESTLKNRLHTLFSKIGVPDRVSFLAGYSQHVLVLDSDSQDPPYFF